MLVHEKGKIGTVEVSLIPTNENGEGNLAEDAEIFIENPNDLLGQKLTFIVFIDHANLPEISC